MAKANAFSWSIPNAFSLISPEQSSGQPQGAESTLGRHQQRQSCCERCHALKPLDDLLISCLTEPTGSCRHRPHYQHDNDDSARGCCRCRLCKHILSDYNGNLPSSMPKAQSPLTTPNLKSTNNTASSVSESSSISSSSSTSIAVNKGGAKRKAAAINKTAPPKANGAEGSKDAVPPASKGKAQKSAKVFSLTLCALPLLIHAHSRAIILLQRFKAMVNRFVLYLNIRSVTQSLIRILLI